MSYLPDDMPLPLATPDDAPYWQSCRERQLRIQCCGSCHTFRHPPMPLCAECGSSAIEWAPVSGNGTVFSYTVAYHPTHPALKSAVPYNIAVVMLDDAGDVRLVSNIVDAAPEEMRVGLPVALVWEPTSDGGYLARFQKRDGGAR